MDQIININLDLTHSYLTIINAFDSIVDADEIQVNILHTKNKFIDVGIYPVLCSIINELRANGKIIELNFQTPESCKQLQYAERMDFLSTLGIKYDTGFARRPSNGRFIEIIHIKKGEYYYPTQLENVFLNDFKLDKQNVESLVFLIAEIACNTTMHSKSSNGAYFYCQKYPHDQVLDLYLVDSGIGIATSMLCNPEYEDLPESKLLRKALEFGEGSGEGRGHGLYFVPEFIKRNNGVFQILSNSAYIKEVNNRSVTKILPYSYNGVIVQMKIPFKINTSITELFKEKYG